MSFRISPLWWPGLVLASPVIAPWLLIKNSRYRENLTRATILNLQRIKEAEPLDLPELEFLEITVLVEWRAESGFMGDAGVSCLFETNLGAMLFDVGFGPSRPAFTHNAEKLGFHMDQADALAISHFHCDHMGGIAAQRSQRVALPGEFMPKEPKTCFLPEQGHAPGFEAEVVTSPRMLAAGIGTTGPLARSLFVMGYIEEQSLVARIRNKGLVVFTGCGHPTIEVILAMAARLCDDPLHGIGGGLHFPVSDGRGNRAGIRFQTILGTGKPPWQRIENRDLDRTIGAINRAAPGKVLLSGHDTCDRSLARMETHLDADTLVLKAGKTYRF
ncbi:MAG: MBL fold metallo-hydrolase [Desulfobacteraceae bacterium]|nr:MBL fold metallo-hydrolase [Desulfobacteraceae bacterium]